MGNNPYCINNHLHAIGKLYANTAAQLYHYHEAIIKINKDDGQKYWLIMHSPYPLMNINYWIYPKEAYVDVDTQILHYNNLLHLSTKYQDPTPPVSGYDKIIHVEQIFAEFVDE